MTLLSIVFSAALAKYVTALGQVNRTIVVCKILLNKSNKKPQPLKPYGSNTTLSLVWGFEESMLRSL